MRRMDRYKEDDNQISRYKRNQDLYQNYSTNTIYTNISDITNDNAYEISNNVNNSNSYRTREAYQQMQRYQDTGDIPRTKKELEDFNYLYPKKDNKIYDINSVLEEARKNRQEKDEREEKRKLKNNEYNILSGMNIQELEKYREEKKKRLTTSEEEIRELIDTIASKTLAGEIDKATSVNLLSDLMATSIMDKVEASSDLPEIQKEESKEEKTDSIEQIEETSITEEIEKEKEENEENNDKTEEKDLDFYTRSMDLSEKDFNLSDDFKESSLPIGVKILIALIIIAIIIITGYFIYKRFF